jgi:hypothetical protein
MWSDARAANLPCSPGIERSAPTPEPSRYRNRPSEHQNSCPVASPPFSFLMKAVRRYGTVPMAGHRCQTETPHSQLPECGAEPELLWPTCWAQGGRQSFPGGERLCLLRTDADQTYERIVIMHPKSSRCAAAVNNGGISHARTDRSAAR